MEHIVERWEVAEYDGWHDNNDNNKSEFMCIYFVTDVRVRIIEMALIWEYFFVVQTKWSLQIINITQIQRETTNLDRHGYPPWQEMPHLMFQTFTPIQICQNLHTSKMKMKPSKSRVQEWEEDQSGVTEKCALRLPSKSTHHHVAVQCW